MEAVIKFYRNQTDREALREGLIDGTIDMIATDHAPHSEEEKSKGLAHSAFGITGLETAFPVLFTELVLGGIISMEKLVKLMSVNPRKRFFTHEDEDIKGYLDKGQIADITVLDINDEYKIDPETFASKGKSTPFTGMEVRGRVLLTMSDGEIVYRSKDIKDE